MAIELDTTGMTPEEESELNSLLAELESLIPDATPASEAELDRLLGDLAEEMKGYTDATETNNHNQA